VPCDSAELPQIERQKSSGQERHYGCRTRSVNGSMLTASRHHGISVVRPTPTGSHPVIRLGRFALITTQMKTPPEFAAKTCRDAAFLTARNRNHVSRRVTGRKFPKAPSVRQLMYWHVSLATAFLSAACYADGDGCWAQRGIGVVPKSWFMDERRMSLQKR
jgi:hypothetical protein